MFQSSSTATVAKSGTQLGPYRATRLWNDVIRTFRAGMPTGRHRRQLRTHEDCFVATEAVNWLHSHLTRDPNFGTEVTRSQTIQLLQKFMKAKVFADVRGSKYNKEEFEDNGKLYRFMPSSPLKAVRTPLAVKNTNSEQNQSMTRPAKIDYEKLKPVTCIPEEGVPRCEVLLRRVLSAVEIEQEYKAITLNSIKRCLGLQSLQEILDDDWVSGKTIMHNLTYVSKTGYVTNVDKKDQLPTWVLSAMRCLANWPHRVDENIPDYPGFEKDVFKVVQDYFQKLREPLLTYAMYDLITNVLVKIEAASKQPPTNTRGRRGSNQYSSIGSIPMFASAENLMMNLTMNNQHEVRGQPKLSPIYAEWDRMLHGGTSSSSFRPVSGGESGVSVGYSNVGRRHSAQSLQSSRGGNETYTVYKPRALSADLGYNSSITDTSRHGENTQSSESVRSYANTNNSSSYNSDNNNNSNNKPRYTIVRLDSHGNLLAPLPQTHDGSDDADRSNQSTSQNLSNRSNLSCSQKFSSMHNLHDAPPGANLVQSNRFYSTSDLSNAQQFLDASLKNKSPHHGSSRSTVDNQYTSGSLLTLSHHTDHPYSKQADRSLPRYVSPPAYRAEHQPVICGTIRRQTSASSTASYKTAPSQNNSTGMTSYNSAQSLSNVARLGMSRHNTSGCMNAVNSAQPSSNTRYDSPSQKNLSQNRYPSATNLSSTPILRDSSSNLSRYISSTSLFSSDVELKVESALQLCCLLLPPGNRRKLHLLLRLLNKMSKNESLAELDSTSTVRTLVLQTFSRSILRCQEEADLDELLALRLVSFMIDHYEAIMKVPEDLKTQVEDKLVYLRRAKIRYSPDEFPIAYCAQVSKAEFEAQAMTSSQVALNKLLDTIVDDAKMSDKDKKKKLKLFQKTYPEIYNKKFPESQQNAYKPKIKQPLLARPLQKLRTLRL